MWEERRIVEHKKEDRIRVSSGDTSEGLGVSGGNFRHRSRDHIPVTTSPSQTTRTLPTNSLSPQSWVPLDPLNPVTPET